jgi:hypothetical protein
VRNFYRITVTIKGKKMQGIREYQSHDQMQVYNQVFNTLLQNYPLIDISNLTVRSVLDNDPAVIHYLKKQG